MWLTIIRLFIDNKVKEIMLKTSYFLENVLYAPVNDENMTGAGSNIESVNIVEDDILGNENSTQQMRDVTLGVCNIEKNDNCIGDASWCGGVVGSDNNVCTNIGLSDSCPKDEGCSCDLISDCKDTTATTRYYARFIPIKLRGYAKAPNNRIYYAINNVGLIKQQWGSGATFASATTGTNITRYNLTPGLGANGTSNYYYIGYSTGSTTASTVSSISSSVTIYAPGHNGTKFTLSSNYVWLPDNFSALTVVNKALRVQTEIMKWFDNSGSSLTNRTLTANCLTMTASTTLATGLFKYTGVDYSFEFSGLTGIDENYYKNEDELKLNDFLNETPFHHKGTIHVVKQYPHITSGHVFPFIKLYTPLRYFNIRRTRPGLKFNTIAYDYLKDSTKPNESPYTNKNASFTSVIGTDYGTITDEIMTLKNLRLLAPELFIRPGYEDAYSDICLNKKYCKSTDANFGFHIDMLSGNSSYSKTLYYQGTECWRKSTIVPNPNSSLYDGVYESFSNSGKNGTMASMYIDINNFDTFKFYIRSYGESSFDYVMVSQLDTEINNNTSVTSSTVKAHTKDLATSGTGITSYTEVIFDNIGGGSHRIQVIYKKDGSQSGGTDQGFVIIPYQLNIRGTYTTTNELLRACDFHSLNKQAGVFGDMIYTDKLSYSSSTATYRNVSLIPATNLQGL